MTLDEDLAKRIAEDAVLSRVLAKADSGTADFTDTSRYHDRMAEIVGAVMREHVLEVPAESRSALCERVLRARYRDSAELLSRVQEALDAALGIRLAPQIPAFQAERAKQIGNSLADQTVSDETIQRRAESASANVVRAFQDRYVQENVRFRTDAGLKCWIVRDAGAKCCDWCAGIDGKYEYGSEPKDVYGRHDNCTCTVTYENGRKRQDVWSKRTWEQPEPGAGAGAPTVFGEEERPRGNAPVRFLGTSRPDGSGLTSRLEFGTMQAGASAYYPESIAGVRRGAEMSFDEADHRSANPNRRHSKAYRENCQSCVVTFEARLRGYDVSAAPYDRHSATYALSVRTNHAWFVPGTNEHPDYITDLSIRTSEQMLEFLEKTIRQGQRYSFQYLRKSGGAHIICADRDEKGNLRLYDPQMWKVRKGKSIARLLDEISFTSQVPENHPMLLRIDNMEFNTSITDKVMRARPKK